MYAYYTLNFRLPFAAAHGAAAIAQAAHGVSLCFAMNPLAFRPTKLVVPLP